MKSKTGPEFFFSPSSKNEKTPGFGEFGTRSYVDSFNHK